jgi:ribosome maturation factor RimP
VYRDIPEEMKRLVEPIVEDHGLELVDVEQRRGRAPWAVRVIVDTAAGDGRVGVEQCADLSREIAAGLDAVDAISARYTLEVSSPGLDRLLARPKDFAAAVGREVRIETRAPIDGRRRFRGRLVAFEGDALRLELPEGAVAIPFEAVARARRVYEFTREDFTASGARRAAGGEMEPQ